MSFAQIVSMNKFRQIISRLFVPAPPRQTSIGTSVPHAKPKDRDEVLANLEWVKPSWAYGFKHVPLIRLS